MASTGFVTLDRVEPRRGAAVLVDVLRSEGVRYVFGNPGTTELPLVDALTSVSEISYILGLHEAGVVAMADGYAQASGRPGFVNLHTAGGLGHAMGSIISAGVSNTPLVITAGQQDTRHGHADPLLSGDLVGVAGPVMKWTHEVLHPDHIPSMVRRAFNDSAAAPAGPVFLSLPIDVMERTTSVSPGQASRIDRRAVAGSLDELGDALSSVAPGRLALLAGDEIFASDAGTEVVALAEAFGAPVFGSSWPGHITFPTSHPLWAGCLPTKATEMRALFERFDAIFALGGNSAIAYLYTEGPALPSTCRLFQLSNNAGNLGRVHATALSCMGDIRASLRAMLPALDRKLARQGDAIAALRASATRDHEARCAMVAEHARAEHKALATTPLVAAREVIRAAGPDIAIVDEACATFGHVRSFLHSSSTRQYAFMRGAILGWGIPAAIGTCLGLDRQPVLALLGDGAALYSSQSLWTAAHERLPVTFVVMNNREYNILKNYMKGQAHYLSPRAGRFIGMDIVDPPVDFLALASAMGMTARRIERATDIAGAVEAGIASGLPNLIEIPISRT